VSLHRLVTETVSLNPVLGIDVCPRLFVIFSFVGGCLCDGLITRPKAYFFFLKWGGSAKRPSVDACLR
jgi:hypothetical protein